MPLPYIRCAVCYISILVFSFSLECTRSHISLHTKEVINLLEEGKRQYNLVESKATMPSLGGCWKNSVLTLREGCQQLNDHVQSDIALKFANCFLEGAGLAKHECGAVDLLQRDSCLKNMPDRAFIAYTEFYTHTQSMCFFIMSQIWHEETEKTIDRLSTSAADVARQLEESEEIQEELLKNQKQSVVLQRELLDNGQTLGSMLHESRDSLNIIFHEFRSSTLEQQRLLSMVFHHLSALQSWVVGEVSWVDSIAFYVPSFAFVYFLTSAQRSANARIPLMLTLVLAGLAERFAAHILLQVDNDPNIFHPIDVLNERVNWWVWLIRRAAIVIDLGVLLVALYRYRDREQVMHQLLHQIQKQNQELLSYIKNQKSTDKVNGQTHFRVDETDNFSFGYMPVLNTSSLPTPERPVQAVRISDTPVRSRPNVIKPIASRPDGVTHPINLDQSCSPVIHSPFRPIREIEQFEESSVISSSLNDRTEGMSVEPQENTFLELEGQQAQSTPVKKNKERKIRERLSSSSSHYNLRRSRSSALSV